MRPRVLVIFLSEATMDLLRPFAAAGKLPAFSKLMSKGVWGRLKSQVPIATPQVVGTLLTGYTPGRHGLMDFFQRGNAGRFREIHGGDLQVPPVWQVLSERGVRCAIINIPFTYPVQKVNGLMISGQEAPGVHPSIFYPKSLYKDVMERFGRYPMKDIFPGGRTKDDYLTLMGEDAGRMTDIFEHLLKTNEWDFGMVFFSHAAMAQHYFWSDHESNDPSNPYSKVIESAYVALDKAAGRLIDAAGPDTTVFVVSDTGAGVMRSGVNINTFLKKEGFLSYKPKPAGGTRKGGPGLVEKARRFVQGKLTKGPLEPLYFYVNHYLAPVKGWIQSHLSGSEIDWSRTQAFSRGQWGYIYINLKGRDPNGTVAPGAEYEAVCKRITDALLALRDPKSGEPAVTRVWRKEEMYSGPMIEWAPDLIIDWVDAAYYPNESAQDFETVFSARQREYMSWPTTGTHRIDGVLIASGPGIAAASEPVNDARIIDMVPTWLRALNQPVPEGLEGKVVSSLFQQSQAS